MSTGGSYVVNNGQSLVNVVKERPLMLEPRRQHFCRHHLLTFSLASPGFRTGTASALEWPQQGSTLEILA